MRQNNYLLLSRQNGRTMSQSIQNRLNDCKQFLLDEQRSKKPSKLYISDLENTIKMLELQLGSKQPFEVFMVQK